MSEVWTTHVLLVGTGYSSTCTLVSNGAHRVLIDTGLSIQEDALLTALQRQGLSPADIDIIVNTHLHVDHCGNNALFERARIFMSDAEWRWTRAFYSALFATRKPEVVLPDFYPEIATHGLSTRTVRNVARMARLFWDEKRLGQQERFHWLEQTALPDGLDVLPTPGHTPHHVSIRVTAPEPVIVAGDAVLAENADARVKTMVPFSRAQALATREDLLRRGLRVVPGHGAAFLPASAQAQSLEPKA